MISYAVTGWADTALKVAVGTTYVKARSEAGAAIWAQLHRPLPWMRRAKRFTARPYRPEHDRDFQRGGVRVARINREEQP